MNQSWFPPHIMHTAHRTAAAFTLKSHVLFCLSVRTVSSCRKQTSRPKTRHPRVARAARAAAHPAPNRPPPPPAPRPPRRPPWPARYHWLSSWQSLALWTPSPPSAPSAVLPSCWGRRRRVRGAPPRPSRPPASTAPTRAATPHGSGRPAAAPRRVPSSRARGTSSTPIKTTTIPPSPTTNHLPTHNTSDAPNWKGRHALFYSPHVYRMCRYTYIFIFNIYNFNFTFTFYIMLNYF